MDVRRTVLVGHPAGEMFDVIEAAEHYPAFLPWCASATIVERSDTVVVADIVVDFHGVRFGFRTRNPKRRPEWMAINLEHGPFRDFGGTWNLKSLGAEGCHIDFDFTYHFDSTPMARLARPVFDRIVNTLVDRFVARADAVCRGHEPAAVATAPADHDETAPRTSTAPAAPPTFPAAEISREESPAALNPSDRRSDLP